MVIGVCLRRLKKNELRVTHLFVLNWAMPTEPFKRVCYADELTVWATGVKIPDMEDSLNSYLEEIAAYLKDNSC